MAAVFTPSPTCAPAGTMEPASEELEPTRRRFWYIRSWNSARRRLKPVVVMLAMLLEMTSTLVCWACMPVLAMSSARMMFFLSLSVTLLQDFFDRRHLPVAFGLHE